MNRPPLPPFTAEVADQRGGDQKAEVRRKTRMGLFIGAWSGLPIEAVCVWMAVSYSTTIIFEIIKLWLASGKTAKAAFLGRE